MKTQTSRRHWLNRMTVGAGTAVLFSRISPLLADAGSRGFKIGAPDWSLNRPDPTCFDVAKQIGLDGVQLDLGNLKNGLHLRRVEVQQSYLAASRKSGVAIGGLALAALNETALKSEPRTAIWLHDSIATAKALGVKVILVAQFGHGDVLGDAPGLGRRILRSTKQQDRQSALAVAMEFERASKLARRGELVEAQAREVLRDIMKRADIGETIQSASIQSHFDGWLASKRARKSKATGERYGMAVNAFLKTLGRRARLPLTSLTARDVETFLNARTAENLSPATLNLDVKIIGGALNAARRQGLIPTNPAEAVELPEVVSTERGTFTPDEVRMLVDAAEGEWKLLIPLAYYTAARLGDCCRMQWEGVDLAGETLTYTQAKTGKKVIVPLHPDLLARLNRRAGTDKPEVFILPQLASQRVSGRRGLSETFKKIMRKAGLDLQTVKGTGKQMFSRRTFHSLRHTSNSEMANKGVSAEVRMGVTGHKSAREHQKYTHLEMDTRRAAVGKIPSLG